MCAQCITSGLAMPHNLRKCSALRIRAVVNKFIQEHMDFRYSGDWTVNVSGQAQKELHMDHPLTQAVYPAFHHTSALLLHPGLHNTAA